MIARRLLVILALACAAALLATPHSIEAQSGSERIDAYDVVISVQRDGVLRIIEDIDYNFGAIDRHGIERIIPTRLRYDDTYDRDEPLHVEKVEATNASAKYELKDAGSGRTNIRIGDADKTVNGLHHYRITYTIGSALNAFDDHDELYWNAIGNEWRVPIVKASTRVDLPDGATPRVACFAGPQGSALACSNAQAKSGGATFAQGTVLAPGQGMTVVVGFPKGLVSPAPTPKLIERWSLLRAFSVTPFTVVLAALVLVGAVWLVIRIVWRSGRDIRRRGSPNEVIFGNSEQSGEQLVPLFEGGAYAIEYTPPEGIRPGQVGTLLDEVAHPRDVSASIVDLAARGYLNIEEIAATGWFGKPDWRFTRQPTPTEKRALLPYEQKLLDNLFQSGDIVELATLKQAFATRLSEVQDLLYDDVVSEGWFSSRPDRTRGFWLGASIAAVALAVALEVAVISFTHWALVPVGLVVAALLLLTLHNRMPRRTAKGTAALRRTLGFRDFIQTAETRRAEFAEQSNLFYEYLPYAVVFGCVDKWAKTFEGLALTAPTWYASSSAFNALYFASAMDGFADTTSSALVSTPGGSGSSGFGGGGFSGGGGGGGGGGSW